MHAAYQMPLHGTEGGCGGIRWRKWEEEEDEVTVSTVRNEEYNLVFPFPSVIPIIILIQNIKY